MTTIDIGPLARIDDASYETGGMIVLPTADRAIGSIRDPIYRIVLHVRLPDGRRRLWLAPTELAKRSP